MNGKGIIFDMDGVITDTRRAHYQAWKTTFDIFLGVLNKPPEFSESDYQTFVDGRPREEGITSFLSSRDVKFTSAEVEELAREKNERYLALLKSLGPLCFPEVAEVLAALREKDISLGLITSSKNAQAILNEAGPGITFDVVIDRTVGERLGLKGKPSPDYFLEAAARLGLAPYQCVIVEDSIAGIQAGIEGGFFKVVGVSREGQTSAKKLLASGADIVVGSLSELLNWPMGGGNLHGRKKWTRGH